MKKQAIKRVRGRPRLHQEKDTRNALLLAAIELFGERGFDGVSLSQVADQAGGDVALIRYYFGSKEDLWQGCIDHLSQLLESETLEVISQEYDSETDRLKAVVRWFVDMSAKWPQVSRIIVFEGNNPGSRGQYVIEKLVGPFYAGLSQLIKAAKAEGSISDVDPRTLFFMITHGGSFPMALPVLTNSLPGGDIGKTRNIKKHAQSIIDLVFVDIEK